MSFDYIIVGAGSAGCVLADRLTADGRSQVLLLEAGPPDTDPMIAVPKGLSKVLRGPKRAWRIPVQGADGCPAEFWPRGRTLGGSSSVNGLVYFRGHPEDYEGWKRAGRTPWGWTDFQRAFEAIDGLAGPGETAPAAPLKVSIGPPSELGGRVIAAAEALGHPHAQDISTPGAEGVGYVNRTIFGGRRQSAAGAFLRPARKRRNLCVRTDVTIDKVLFEGSRAVGVLSTTGEIIRTPGEVILSAGTIMTPQILQRSGVGRADDLQKLGIAVVADSPDVGRRLIEHRIMNMNYQLNRPLSANRQHYGIGLLASILRYGVNRTGALADASCEVGGLLRSDQAVGRPDMELLMSPYTYVGTPRGAQVSRQETFNLFGWPLQCRSEGSISISSASPDAPATIVPNYLADPYDQQVTVALVRFIRRLVAQAPLAEVVDKELTPGPSVETDSEILDAFRARGQGGLHALGTARMGADPHDPVDPQLRVRGVQGLRVVDLSVFPTTVGSNTNGPVMAMAWLAAETIRDTPLRP